MDFLPIVLPPVFGFAIGLGTNALAIRMLFRPHDEVRFLGLRFQGMIPRRKADIARNVARIVARELLREESVAERVAGADVRRAFETLALDLADRYLERDYAALAEILGEERRIQVEEAVGQALVEAARAAQEWAATPEAGRAARVAMEALLERTPRDLLRGEEGLVTGILRAKVDELLAAPDLEDRVRDSLAHLLVRLAGSERGWGTYLPEEVRRAVDRAVRAAVPNLLRRFEEALLSAPNVRRIKGAVRSGIEAYLLETEGGVVKNLVRQVALLGRERIFREADEIVDANLHRLGELIYEEENRSRIEETVGASVEELLGRTPAELLASLPPETLDLLYTRAAAWVCGYARRSEVSASLHGLLERELHRFFRTPLRDLVEASGLEDRAAQRWGALLVRWAREGGLEATALRMGPDLARAVVRAPVGRPARYLPPGLVRELTGLALDRLVPVVAAKVPEILRVVDVQGLIEREILAFSPREIEAVILSVSRRELRAITWWGGILGALVGGVQAVLAMGSW